MQWIEQPLHWLFPEVTYLKREGGPLQEVIVVLKAEWMILVVILS
jgi:hypothetical protein